MVSVKPVDNEAEIAELFNQHGIELCEGAMAMIAVEKGERVGSAVFKIAGEELTLLSVIYPKQDQFICDLVSRGVMNYGVNRGMLYCELGEKAPKAEFLMFGFIKDINETSVNIIRTFTMCTHCKADKNKE